MKEIKLTFKKGGKVVIDDKSKKSSQFTEKLSEELGEIEERHKGGTYDHVDNKQQIQQRQ